jgi:hypothetical protein
MMPTLWQQNLSGVSSRWLSPAIWSTCPLEQILSGRADGYMDGDDFKNTGLEDGDDDTTLPLGYDRYIDTSNTIRFVSVTETIYYGALALVTDATDNDGPVIHRVTTTNAAGSNVSAPFVISDTAGSAFPLWFEARLKKSSVTDNQCAFAIGLSQGILDTRAADNGLLTDNTGDIVDSISFIGFRNLHDNGEELDFVYQDGAQTAPTEVIANIASLTADTYFKVGFYFDPQADGSKRITIFYNGMPQSTYVTATNIAASTFPDGDMMGFVAGSKNGEATATTLTLDWWKCVQLYSPTQYD